MEIGDRTNLSGDLVMELRSRLLDGRLPAGSRINEVHFASTLGISRSPLREALTRLTADGVIVHHPRRGFFARALTIEEVEQVYPVRAILEPEALALAGLPSSRTMESLVVIAESLGHADSATQALDLEDNWFHALWDRCGNPVLIELIEQFMRRTRRYEYWLMADQGRVGKAVESKKKVIAHLKEENIEAACAQVRTNLNDTIEPIKKWLRSRSA